MPDDFRGHDVEDETAEEAVFSIRDEIEDLLRRAGEHSRELGLDQLDKLVVFLAEVGNDFVVEGLTEAVGVVAEV